MKIKGYLLAAIAAAAYGTNPIFALPLYANGMNPNSVLLFRYALGLPLLALLVRARGHSLLLSRKHMAPVALLGVLMAFSSLTLFKSFEVMNPGLASTLLFVYPVMVALLMIIFYGEKFKISTGTCLILMIAGLALLLRTPQGGDAVSGYGVVLVMISALTYSLYMIFVNVIPSIRSIPTSKLMFYLLLWGTGVFMVMAFMGEPLQAAQHPVLWINLIALAVIPTLLSLACTTRAIQLVGSTPTAILGALEPVTAVVLSVTLLDQSLTMREVYGGVLVVLATTLVVADSKVEMVLLHVRKMFPRRNRRSGH